ncbi:DUF979 domain-containing protein [Sphingomonas montana]|uniref:DUF979 domain-containing protein n=1 Tax=Sphingomonas montana TaxID=1843236 RepID=UPI00096DA1F0|nr:DUF979 domain-containing protein [Sphingomonas montana]
MIGLDFVYAVAGATFAAFAWLSLVDRSNPRRFGTGAFYGLIAVSFFGGDRLGDIGNGVLVLALVALGGTGAVGRGATVAGGADGGAGAARHGNRLFLPALIVPVVALAGTLLKPAWIDPKQVTLVSLTIGVLIALAACYAWFRPAPRAPFDEGRRLMDGVGWAAVLPQMLAALGAVFALAGVGDVVGGLAARAIPDGNLFVAVLVYGLGMAGFTIVMGNAFAAFPVMTAGVGVPVLVRGMGGDPALIAAIGMLAGFCGTLLTPMAANFNLVPAVLLDLDRTAVIRAQAPTAVVLLAVNILLIYFLGFRT